MAKWIGRVTVKANHFDMGNGAVIRDSQADKARKKRVKSTKRLKRKGQEAGLVNLEERLHKLPRMAAILERVRGRENSNFPLRGTNDGVPSDVHIGVTVGRCLATRLCCRAD